MNIPTAKQFIRNKIASSGLPASSDPIKVLGRTELYEYMEEYSILKAQLHVKAALKAASEKGTASIVNDGCPPFYRNETPKKAVINKDSILNAYDISQIK